MPTTRQLICASRIVALVDDGVFSSGNVKETAGATRIVPMSLPALALYAISTGCSLFSRTPGIEVDLSKVFHRFGPKALETLSKPLCQFFVANQ